MKFTGTITHTIAVEVNEEGQRMIDAGQLTREAFLHAALWDDLVHGEGGNGLYAVANNFDDPVTFELQGVNDLDINDEASPMVAKAYVVDVDAWQRLNV